MSVYETFESALRTLSKYIVTYGCPIPIVINCKTVVVRLPTKSTATIMSVVLSASFMVSCGSRRDGLNCSSIQSVSGFVQRFSLGLDNFSENQYQQLRLDTLDVLDTVTVAARESVDPEKANQLVRKINLFITSMDEVSWDVSRALQTNIAVDAANSLGSEQTLRDANEIESFVIRKCGLPSTVPVGSEGEIRLPDPSVPSPTATDPPANTINEISEAQALGTTIANIFALTLDVKQLRCLGESLSDIVDLSDASSNSAQYQGQFQKAFDECNIQFSVPVD